MLALKKSARMVADLVFLIVMVTTTMPTIIQGLPQLDISGLVGQTIRLPCNVDMEKCGNLHSIKWYRGSSRIFVFSEMAKIARSEGDYVERAELHYTPNSTVSELEVKQLQVADEAVYKCEITYIEVREGCAVVQFINLTALIKPEYVKVTKGDGTELTNATLIGPYTEGDELTLVCESGGGKPIPSVSWWNGTHKMAGEYTAESGPNSVGTGRNRVHMTLGRGDLGAKYECRAENAALNAPIVSNIRVEVNVRPLKLELSGLEHHVVQGTIVVLKCDVIGARPKANITWYNGTKALPEGGPIVTSYDLQEDGTSSTQSRLEFTASRFENGGLLMCEGSNPVMTSRDEKPLRDTINLEVLYPPIVTLSPENVTVDEGQDFHLYLEYQSNPAALKVVRWYREGIEVVSSSDHYEGGTTDFYNLSIRNSTRYDQGVYTVVLENEVGASEPNDAIYVSIYFKPTVSLTMETSTLTPTPVRELDRMNITLVCRVEQGNPDLLIGVRWYLGGELLKELPDCEGGNATSPASAASDLTFCDIDPSRLLLENVGRGFHGNYSCEGRNEAGWGPLSQDQELVVYYPPGPSTLVYEPREVVKKGTVTLRCTVEEPGYPETSTFKWMRGTHHIPNVTSASLTNPVTLETESNFTCLAYNEGGEGEPATIYIDVLAPPAFIGRLPLYHGALVTAQNVSVSCRVECSPLCAVHWLKNGQHLGDTSRAGSQYRVNNTVLPPDTRSGDFESTLSTLVWNMAAWPGGRLDRIHDNDNYTCQSDDNIAGPGVRSSTIFRVEYPPENITVSNKRVNVTETDVPEWVICNAKAYPEAMYQWYKDGERNTTVLKGGNTLILSGPLKKERGGNYTCEAFNRHGNITQKTFINVLYKPQCGITQSDQDGKLVLVCTADANPTDVDFTWRIKNENDTIEENIEKRGLQSFLTLDTYVETFRTYLCFANNSVGMSIPCERDVTGHLGWWRMENENMIIVVAVVIGGIIMVLIICVIIIIVCRRKRADDKYPNPSTTKDKSKPDLVSSPSDGMLQPDGDKAFYENLPFHGMQSAPNKPYRPEFSDLDYADVDYRSYGPINYKKASIDVLEQQNRAPSVDNQQRPTRPPKNPSPDLL